ncbi:MAG TPA: DUF2905 domain-containing protein [Methylomirabilota bacterium]|nr:DUF2905 domain-containing protein [Methylomirabilota bacterium]
MQDIGKLMVIGGAALVILGLVFWLLGGRLPLGRLPGDISYNKGNMSFFFPLTTCILVSVILSLLLWLFRR